MVGTLAALVQETGSPGGGAQGTGLLGGYLDFAVTLAGLVVILGIAHFLLERRRFLRLPPIGRQLVLLVLTLSGVFALAIAWPGSNTEALQILGILIGAAVAFGSTTFIGQGLAGLMLRSARPFEIGDWLMVEDHFGAVFERGLFHVVIQTPHMDLTTLPYLYLTSHAFTVIPARPRISGGTVREPGTRVSADVSLGYDANHSRVESLLKAAVERIGLGDPRVHIMELGDFAVTYRVQGVTDEIDRLLAVRSRLREEVLDSLHGADIEIASPTLMNTRSFESGQRFMAKPSWRERTAEETPLEEEEVDLPEVVAAKELDTQRVELQSEADQLRKGLKEAEGAEKERLEAELRRAEEALDALGGEGPADIDSPGAAPAESPPEPMTPETDERRDG